MDISNMAHTAADNMGWTEPGTIERTAIMKAFKMGFEAGLSEETAGKIWVAACQYTNGTDFHGNKVDAPDFETFYKQLIEGK